MANENGGGILLNNMTSLQMKRMLEERLAHPKYRTSYNRDKEQFRIEWRETKKGMTIHVPQVVVKYAERGEAAIDDLVAHVTEALKIMNEEHELAGMEKRIFPVIRSTSFPIDSNGKKLATREHTAETRIFYALDLGRSYRLIDEEMLEQENWTLDNLHEIALFNLRSLKNDYKTDEVQDNIFYFVATQDGYDASRILNESLLTDIAGKCTGDIAISVPHQDVLIIGDIRNETGYAILAQMTMQFFAEGRIPITSLSFIYEDNILEPIFIMARNKPENAD